jgi:hypothetical protein
MRVPGSVGEWEEWTEMTFPETGAYVVPDALVPVEIDRERDEGLYVEPNVWMVHPASTADDVRQTPGCACHRHRRRSVG